MIFGIVFIPSLDQLIHQCIYHSSPSDMKKKVTILQSEILLNDFLTISAYQLSHDLFAGGSSPVLRRLRLEKGKAVSVLLYDPLAGNVVMVEQFRIGAIQDQHNPWMLEIIAGYIEEGETAEGVAHRESHEESGCVIMDLIKIGSYLMNPGNSTDKTTIFCGKVDASTANGIHGMVDEGEDIRVRVLDFEKVMQAMRQGIIYTGIPVIALQWLGINRNEIRERWRLIDT